MEKDTLKTELFKRFLANASNAAELEQLFGYLGEAKDRDLANLIQTEFEQESNFLVPEEEERLHAVHLELSKKLFAQPERRTLRLTNQSLWFKVAAVLLLVVSISLVVFNLSKTPVPIVPGTAKAMLSFDGEEKALGKKAGVVYQQGKVTVSTKADGTIVIMALGADSATAAKLNTITTPRGGEYRILLSDGSKVMLNAGSTLTFPTGFRGATRRVDVDGEAYFEIAKNPAMPFIVGVNGQKIQVLGTKFNVSSYPEDEGTITTLLEGSVRFVNEKGTQLLLKPNQQAIAKNGSLNVQNVEAEDFIAWSNGSFLFNDVPLSQVMQKLGRWYNVNVDLNSLPKKNLYLKISRTASIGAVLKLISSATGQRFELQEDTIVLKE